MQMKKSEKEKKERLTGFLLLLPAVESCPCDLKYSCEREESGRGGKGEVCQGNYKGL